MEGYLSGCHEVSISLRHGGLPEAISAVSDDLEETFREAEEVVENRVKFSEKVDMNPLS